MKFLLTVLGVVLILEGIPWFLSPAGVRRVLAQLATLPDPLLRLVGFGGMISGLLVVWLAL